MSYTKNLFATTICLFFVLLIVKQLNAQEVSLKPYGIESGIIEYKYSGSQVGTGTIVL